MSECAVLSCPEARKQNEPELISTHPFPLDPERRLKWVLATGRKKTWIPTNYYHICGIHFMPECFNAGTKHGTLNEDAIPTLHLPEIDPNEAESSEDAEQEDDMIVVIIGDDDAAGESENCVTQSSDLEHNKKKAFHPVVIKQEFLDQEEETRQIEVLIETAEKHGVPLNFNIEDEVLNFKPDVKVKQEEQDPEYIIDDYAAYDSNEELEFLSDYEEKYVPAAKTVKNKEKQLRRGKMLEPAECKSFVNDLRQSYPELERNSELLVETLSEIMRTVKPPNPPRDYFLMRGSVFECNKCTYISETQPAASRHWQEKHGTRYLVCYACGVDFRSTTNLYKHEKRCRAADAEIVLKARAHTLGMKGRNRPFIPDPNTLQARVTQVAMSKVKKENKNAAPLSACDVCGAALKTRVAWEAHQHLHAGRRPYVCGICRASYTAKSALNKHMALHKDIQFICDHCGRSFKIKSALVTHLDTHRPEKRFGCDLCHKRFAQKMALTLHEDRVHKGLPPPCACQMCPKRYPRMSLLKTHMLREHGMNLLTKNMLYKLLPKLTKTNIEDAQVVFKCKETESSLSLPELEILNASMEQEKLQQKMAEKANKILETQLIEGQLASVSIDPMETEDSQNYIQYIQLDENNLPTDQELSEEVKQYMQQLHGVSDPENIQVIYVQNGEVVQVSDGSELSEENVIQEVNPNTELRVTSEPKKGIETQREVRLNLNKRKAVQQLMTDYEFTEALEESTPDNDQDHRKTRKRKY